ncbi:HAAS domain-containing protein [Paenibacillus sp. J2TS4]|uniref:HAAS domain-containing protein n=1 Tax=Paenibacillus sp. J2TS4 TaxID=2807194 RepID=UPI001B221162|nr:DUF1700 domain-containing protein [Paenibacillus sp. J2TS4]GIP35629.1 hypothetical protein J2TS4_48390 [Paenibacillus sp. J2TS4]
MSKEAFFRNLEYKLKGLPEQERRQIIQVYEDLFQTASENGKDENEVASYLGYASQDDHSYARFVQHQHISNHSSAQGARALMASVALGLFNLIVVLTPFMVVSAVLLALSIVSIALLAMSIFIWLPPFTETLMVHKLFLSMSTFGLGMLIGIAMVYSIKWYVIIVSKYIRINVNLIRGE